MNKDAIIAKALGTLAGHHNWVLLTDQYGECSVCGIYPSDPGPCAPTYASDPSLKTEDDIKQWVDKQPNEFREKVADAIFDLFYQRGWSLENEGELTLAALYLVELGDWANALLEVLDE